MAKGFKDMNLDELTEHRASIKKKIEALKDEARAAKVVQDILVQEQHVEEARKQMQILADKSGRTLEEEAEYWQGRLTFGEGSTPDPGRWVQSNLVLGKSPNVRI